jgi:penicillin-binding protein 1C
VLETRTFGAVKTGTGGSTASRAARAAWLPWPGRHRLELVDARGEVIDSVNFEVRGAFAKTAAPAVK